MMRLPPGLPVTSSIWPSLKHEGRGHRTERALAGADRVGVAADQPIGVRYARFGGEVVHFVVEQDAGAGGDDAGAIGKFRV
jgi:hypothetical protein